jgi:hypothetical protein
MSDDLFDVSGKVAIITGGASGLVCLSQCLSEEFLNHMNHL